MAVYAGALTGGRGEFLSFDNWTVIGIVTLVAWLIGSTLVTFPVLRLLAWRGSTGAAPAALASAGAVLAVVPLWLTVGFWYGWHPRHLLACDAGLLGLLYATSGIVLGLSLARSRQRGNTMGRSPAGRPPRSTSPRGLT